MIEREGDHEREGDPNACAIHDGKTRRGGADDFCFEDRLHVVRHEAALAGGFFNGVGDVAGAVYFVF